MHPLLLVMGQSPPTLTGGTWSDIVIVSPDTVENNEDYSVYWIGGAAQLPVTNNWTGAGTLEYRIAAGSWVAYSGSFMIDRGATLAWRYTISTNENVADAQVRVGGALIDTFQISASGFA